MKLLATARFSDTVVQLGKLAHTNPEGLPEVAFVGRSNAGKSSCINLICNRRRLAFSSRTPGRTQALNLFAVGPTGPSVPAGSNGRKREDGRSRGPTQGSGAAGSAPRLPGDVEPAEPAVGYLVDTPGYGFAAAPPGAKRSWQALAGDYIRQRGPLVGVVLMVDIRRQLTDLDRQLLGWVPPDIVLIIVMTKADKLGRQQARQAMRQVAAEPLLASRQAGLLVTLFSTLDRTGVEDLQRAVEALLTGVDVDWAGIARPPGETGPIYKPPAASRRDRASTESAGSAESAASPAEPAAAAESREPLGATEPVKAALPAPAGNRPSLQDPGLRIDTGGNAQ